MPGKGDKVRAELTAFIDEVDQTQRMSGFFGTTIIRMASTMRTFTEQVDEQFEQVDQRFEQVDRRFEQVDLRFEQVDRRFDAVDRRFEQVDRRFEQVDERFDAVDRRFDRLDTQVGLIGDDVRKMSARMEELFGRIGHQELEGRPPARRRKPPSAKTA